MREWTREQQTERVRRRIRAAVDPDNYHYTPAKENNEYAKVDEYLRVAIYARVSTLNPQQTSSFELQQKYYEDLVRRYPKWTLDRGTIIVIPWVSWSFISFLYRAIL